MAGIVDKGVGFQFFNLIKSIKKRIHQFEFRCVFACTLLLVLHLSAKLHVIFQGFDLGLLVSDEII